MLLPNTIDIRITQKCNLKCKFCFGTNCSKEELTIEEWYSLLDRIREGGVESIVITGGEPTLYPNINDFINYARNKQFNIVLSTNGIELDTIKSLELIDVLSVPLDGKTFLDCKKMRNLTNENYEKVLKNIQLFKETYPQKKLKIGTVLTAKNINSIEGIYDMISSYADVWKIYQVSPHVNNIKYFKRELEISDEVFDNIYQDLLNKYGDKIKIIPYRNRERDGKYLFCEPNGDAVVIANGTEKVISNFYYNYNEVIDNWNEYVDLNRLNKNFNETYLIK